MTDKNTTVRLDDLCEIYDGYPLESKPTRDSQSEIFGVTFNNITRDGRVQIESALKYRFGGNFEKHTVHSGDILFKSQGRNIRAAVVDNFENKKVIAISPVIIIRPKNNKIFSDYIAWFINLPLTQRYLISYVSSKMTKPIPKHFLGNLRVPVIDLNAQKKIVEINNLSNREVDLLRKIARKKNELANNFLINEVYGNIQGL